MAFKLEAELLESGIRTQLGQHVIAVIDKKKRKFSTWYWYIPVAIVGVSLVSVLFTSSRAPKQVEETVTIDSSRHVVIPTGTPLASTRKLPVQERDVETAGDRIAEATMYLKKKQKASALRALHQAQAATNHALAARAPDGGGVKELMTTAYELAAAEHAIQRGALDDAARQLNALNNKLDALAH